MIHEMLSTYVAKTWAEEAQISQVRHISAEFRHLALVLRTAADQTLHSVAAAAENSSVAA